VYPLLGAVVAPVAGMRAQGMQPVAIVGATVIDAAAGRALPNMTVTIRDGVIVSVVRGGPVAAGVRRLEGAGKFLMPGLWDMHAHHQMTGEDSLPVLWPLASPAVAIWAVISTRSSI
jgi:imidazolonepropionase-like amidohydrolase